MTDNTKFKKPELLIPAGNMDKLRSGLLYGADALYLGGDTFNLRASCDGFTLAELAEAVKLAEKSGAQVFYCLNSLPMQADLPPLPGVIEDAANCGVHAFIIADPGVLRLARKYAPQIPVHLSTQVNTTNSEAIAFWAEVGGVSRVNLARELTFKDIAAVRSAVSDIELEVFVHGAMCLAVSGQCLLSAWLNNRPANLGRCTHPCRFDYKAHSVNSGDTGCTNCGVSAQTELCVADSKRPDDALWSVYQDENYSSFWAPQDLCLLPFLPWFTGQGIDSLKVEGRMKSPSYVAHVADAYSTALKAAQQFCAAHPACATPAANDLTLSECTSFDVQPYLQELFNIASRPLGTGFFLPEQRGLLGELLQLNSPAAANTVVARLLEPVDAANGVWMIEVRDKWNLTDSVELMFPGLKRPQLSAGSYALENHKGERSQTVGCGTRAVVHFEADTTFNSALQSGVFVRRISA